MHKHPLRWEKAITVDALQSCMSAAPCAPGRVALPPQPQQQQFSSNLPKGCVGCRGCWMCAPAARGDELHAPSTAPAKPSTGLPCAGTEFRGRAVDWPTAWAKAAQSGVHTMRRAQPLASFFSRTKFACTWRDRWVPYGCNSRGQRWQSQALGSTISPCLPVAGPCIHYQRLSLPFNALLTPSRMLRASPTITAGCG